MTAEVDDVVGSTPIENILNNDYGGGGVASTITDMIIRFLWRCGIFCTGLVGVAMGVLYVKVRACIHVLLIIVLCFF